MNLEERAMPLRSAGIRRALGGGIAYPLLAALLLAVILVAAGCSRVETAPAVPPAVVEVAPVIRRDMRLYREWVGTLDGHINAEIRPQVAGRLLKRLYEEGSFVKKGDLLFEIDPRRAQAALEQARAALGRSERALARMRPDVARATPVAVEEGIAQQEIDEAPSTLREAQANLDSARAAVEMAKLNLTWTRVVSPIDGIAGSAGARGGDLVGADTILTTVSSVDPITVFFYVSKDEYMSWTGARGSIGRPPSAVARNRGIFELVLSDGSPYAYRGDPTPAGRDVDTKTGTITVAAVFPNPDHLLRPGQYGRVRAAVDVSRRALLVPQGAVFERQGLSRVAVVGPDIRVEIRAVRTGDRVGVLWVIEDGLAPGERVIVKGLQDVKAGSVVLPRPVKAESDVPAEQDGRRRAG